jgi:hypothetical protein
MTTLPFTAEHTGPNVLTVRATCDSSDSDGWERWFLLRSDAHHDNPACDQDMEKRHLELALERGAGIIDTGDLFCAMQGKWDKRSDKSNVRPEHQGGDYLDALIRTAADFYEPFAHNWLVIGTGNHETAVKKRHETDLTQRLVATLNDRTGSTIQGGAYTGWVRFLFTRWDTECTSRVLWYTHGYGGGGPVTQDMIQANRQQVYIENADLMMSGHVHRSWNAEFVRHKLNTAGTIERREGLYIKSPTYKDGYGDGRDGYEVEKGHGPRPMGAYWLRFFYDGRRGLQFEVTRAK